MNLFKSSSVQEISVICINMLPHDVKYLDSINTYGETEKTASVHSRLRSPAVYRRDQRLISVKTPTSDSIRIADPVG